MTSKRSKRGSPKSTGLRASHTHVPLTRGDSVICATCKHTLGRCEACQTWFMLEVLMALDGKFICGQCSVNLPHKHSPMFAGGDIVCDTCLEPMDFCTGCSRAFLTENLWAIKGDLLCINCASTQTDLDFTEDSPSRIYSPAPAKRAPAKAFEYE